MSSYFVFLSSLRSVRKKYNTCELGFKNIIMIIGRYITEVKAIKFLKQNISKIYTIFDYYVVFTFSLKIQQAMKCFTKLKSLFFCSRVARHVVAIRCET